MFPFCRRLGSHVPECGMDFNTPRPWRRIGHSRLLRCARIYGHRDVHSVVDTIFPDCPRVLEGKDLPRRRNGRS
jgi:hypothetical protein